MVSTNFLKIAEYVEQHSFNGMVYEDFDNLEITGKQFAIARLSNHLNCRSFDVLVKFLESKGGIVKPNAVKSADYLIITPFPAGGNAHTHKEEREKYEKAIAYHKASGTPKIIRDVDFYIANDMFSKVAADDKRRLILEYINGNTYFTEKTAKKVLGFIAKKARDDEYLQSKEKVMAIAKQTAAEHTSKNNQLPDEKTGTLQQWRKFFALTEVVDDKGPRLILKKCKIMLPSIRVPARIEGKPIISVDRRAFSNLGDTVKEIIIPETVNYINDSAFFQCSGLQRIVIGNPNVLTGYCFVECENLTEIIMDDTNVIKERARYGGKLYVLIH